MSSSVGLERISCPACEHEQFFRVRDLVSATAVPCPGCSTLVSVQMVEEENPHLARLLAILRQLDKNRMMKANNERARPKNADPVLANPPDEPGTAG